MHKVFTYQTLKQSSVRKSAMKLDKVPPIIGNAEISGYEEKIYLTNEGDNYHTIVPKKSKTVKGKLFEVTKAELDQLDEWEDEYDRMLMRTTDGQDVWVYILLDKYKIKKEK